MERVVLQEWNSEPPGGISWEANVIGNRVKGQYICGLVYIAQR